MKLKSIHATSLLSLGEIKFNLENRGILFIKGMNKDTNGSNGAGKSSFMPESVVWTIFGETIRGIEYKDEIVNDKTAGNCMGRVDLEDDYVIVRTRKHAQYGNSLMLFHKDNNISKSSMELTQKEINKLFNIDFDIFVNSIVLSGSSVRANFLDVKNNTLRRQVIEAILGIDRFSDYANTVKLKIKELESQKSNLILNINNLEKQIKNYNDKAAELKYMKEMFEKRKEDKIKTITGDIEKLSKIDVKQQLGIHNKLNEGKEVKSKITGSIQALKNSIRRHDTDKSAIQNNIDRYVSLENKACEYCGSILDQDKVKNMISGLENDKSKIQTQIDSTYEKIKQYNNSLKEIDISIEDLQPDLSEKELYNVESEIKGLSEDLEREKNSQFQDISVSFDSDIDKLSDSIKESKKKIGSLEEEYKYYSFWEIGFGNKGLKTAILEEMLHFLNRKIQFYLNILSKGQINLAFDKYLDFKISGLNYRNCSSGERKRVDLAVLVALYDLTNLRNKSNYNILILDEVLDSIDEIGVEAAKDLLLELNKRISTIFVISHNNALAEYFSEVITVIKENGVSKLEKE